MAFEKAASLNLERSLHVTARFLLVPWPRKVCLPVHGRKTIGNGFPPQRAFSFGYWDPVSAPSKVFCFFFSRVYILVDSLTNLEARYVLWNHAGCCFFGCFYTLVRHPHTPRMHVRYFFLHTSVRELISCGSSLETSTEGRDRCPRRERERWLFVFSCVESCFRARVFYLTGNLSGHNIHVFLYPWQIFSYFRAVVFVVVHAFFPSRRPPKGVPEVCLGWVEAFRFAFFMCFLFYVVLMDSSFGARNTLQIVEAVLVFPRVLCRGSLKLETWPLKPFLRPMHSS